MVDEDDEDLIVVSDSDDDAEDVEEDEDHVEDDIDSEDDGEDDDEDKDEDKADNDDASFSARAKRKGRLNVARADAKVSTIRREIERVFGLPEGSVALCGPDKKRLKGNALIKTLRRRWEES